MDEVDTLIPPSHQPHTRPVPNSLSSYRSPHKNSHTFTDVHPPLLNPRHISSAQPTTLRNLPLKARLGDSASSDNDDNSNHEDDDENDESLHLSAYYIDEMNNDFEDANRPPSGYVMSNILSMETPLTGLDKSPFSRDDTVVRMGPSQHVDYLSHNWQEKDLWSSWQYIVEHRQVYGERSRLENALWRTWVKSQFRLKTASPEALNWLKDVDVTWLYGPLQPASKWPDSQHASETTSPLLKPYSFLHKKSILKRRTILKTLLPKSISAYSSIKDNTATSQAQQDSISLKWPRDTQDISHSITESTSILSKTISRDTISHPSSGSTSSLQTLDPAREKYIRFDEGVEQYIAIEAKGADNSDEGDFNHNPWGKYEDTESSSSDEGVKMMKRPWQKRARSPISQQISVDGDSKMIAKLPSTTIKYRMDSPDILDQQPTWGAPALEYSSQSFCLPTWREIEQELLTVKLISAILVKLEDLRTSHKNLLKKLGTARFVEIYQKSLEVYVLKLSEEGKTALEMDIIEIIENDNNRRFIATHIAEATGQEDEKSTSVHGQTNPCRLPVTRAVVDFLDQISKDDAGDENESLEVNHVETLTFTIHDKVRNFLQKDAPLQTFILRLELIALPPYLREIMETTPKHTIWISNKNDISFMNKCKTIVETRTATQWDWWPLRSRVSDITPDQFRLEWKFCGETLYTKISSQEAVSICQILKVMSRHPPDCHCCTVCLMKVDWITLFLHIIRHYFIDDVPLKAASPSSTGTTTRSKAHLRYSPAGTASLNSGSSIPQRTPSSSPQNNFPGGNVGTQSHFSGANNSTPDDLLWVVFGIKDMRGFHDVENIETHAQLSDPLFFQELKRRHRSRRWCFQYWFSPYRFRYCRFVQFEELLSEHISCIGEALPDEHGYADDYEYNPRPPSATIPLIDPVRFSILLSACNPLCYWSLLPKSIHKCRYIPVDRRFLTRIPQKKSMYSVFSRTQAPNLNATNQIAFGIEAGYMPSYAFFFIYHLILILSGFSFWIYWMMYHPADLQNASVPLFTIIMLMGTFWGLFGKRIGAF